MKKNQMLKSIILTIITLSSINLFAQKSKVIVQLKDASQDSFWFPITDQLRFGEKGSTAFMSVDWNQAKGSFFGELKINEGAGFASYRVDESLNLSKFNEIKLPVMGDGRTYKMILKDVNALNDVTDFSYQAAFKTTAGKAQTVRLKLDNFKPVYRGKVNTDLPGLDKSKIRQLGLQINDKKEGPYKIEFKEWVAQ